MKDSDEPQVISLDDAKVKRANANTQVFQKVHSNRLKSLREFLVEKLAIEAYNPHLFIRVVCLVDFRSSTLESAAGMAGLLPVVWRIIDKCTELSVRFTNFEEFLVTRNLVQDELSKLGLGQVHEQAEHIALECVGNSFRERQDQVFRVLGEKYKVPTFIRDDLYDIIRDMMKYSPFDVREDIREWATLYNQFIDLFSLACNEQSKGMINIPASTWEKKSS